jgi:hypothetical protein
MQSSCLSASPVQPAWIPHTIFSIMSSPFSFVSGHIRNGYELSITSSRFWTNPVKNVGIWKIV